MTTFLAGSARQDITPPLGINMAGYFEPHHADEIVDKIYARALVVGNDMGDTLCLLGCDLIALGADTVAEVRAAVEKEIHVPGSRIMIWATHCHTGPQTVDLFGIEPDHTYMGYLKEQMIKAIAAAYHARQPVTIRAGQTQVIGLNINRRVVFADGTVHTHILPEDESLIVGREGPADSEVGVLQFDMENTHPYALLVNFPLHPTNIRGDRISPDYPGYLDSCLAEPDSYPITVFTNGACGNLDSKTLHLAEVPYGPERGKRIADELAQYVREAISQANHLSDTTVRAASTRISIPLKEVPDSDIVHARSVLENKGQQELYFTRGTRRPSVLKEQVYAAEVLRLAAYRTKNPEVEAEVQVFRIGQHVIVGIPVELFCEFGLAIKRYARKYFQSIMVAELANGYLGYVPTSESFNGGGYETRVARSSQLNLAAGDLLVDAACQLIDSVRN